MVSVDWLTHGPLSARCTHSSHLSRLRLDCFRYHGVESQIMPRQRTPRAIAATGLIALSCLTACSSRDGSSAASADATNQGLFTGRAIAADIQPLDVQAHRGGRGEHGEDSQCAFTHALALGVDTLGVDVTLSRDGVPMVWHDLTIKNNKCVDTGPTVAGDPQFPYVGKPVHDLTYAQLRTLDCSLPQENFPHAHHEHSSFILQLDEVFELAKLHPEVRFNIEIRTDPTRPDESASTENTVNTVVQTVHEHDLRSRVSITSLDWQALPMVKKADSSILTIASYTDGTFSPGSPWLGNISYTAAAGDPLEAADALGVDGISPRYSQSASTVDGKTTHVDVTPDYVKRAHEKYLLVIPWTINDPAVMQQLIFAGVDGIITDYPTRLMDVLAGDTAPIPDRVVSPSPLG